MLKLSSVFIDIPVKTGNSYIKLGTKGELFIKNLQNREIFELYELFKKKELKNKHLNIFIFNNKNVLAHLLLLFLSKNKNNVLKPCKEFTDYIQEYYESHYTKIVVEKPLLSGKEIMEILNIKPSKKVGDILFKLQMAQLSEEVNTKQEAINFVKSLHF